MRVRAAAAAATATAATRPLPGPSVSSFSGPPPGLFSAAQTPPKAPRGRGSAYLLNPRSSATLPFRGEGGGGIHCTSAQQHPPTHPSHTVHRGSPFSPIRTPNKTLKSCARGFPMAPGMPLRCRGRRRQSQHPHHIIEFLPRPTLASSTCVPPPPTTPRSVFRSKTVCCGAKHPNSSPAHVRLGLTPVRGRNAMGRRWTNPSAEGPVKRVSLAFLGASPAISQSQCSYRKPDLTLLSPEGPNSITPFPRDARPPKHTVGTHTHPSHAGFLDNAPTLDTTEPPTSHGNGGGLGGGGRGGGRRRGAHAPSAPTLSHFWPPGTKGLAEPEQ